ncbi:MAG: SHOCT domain-containing protein [Acidimicrobiia bacterium]
MRWHEGVHHGFGWGGLVFVVLVIALIAVLVWLIVGLSRRPATHAAPPAAPLPGPGAGHGPEDILRERLARGEIDPDDFTARLNALRASAPPPGG